MSVYARIAITVLITAATLPLATHAFNDSSAKSVGFNIGAFQGQFRGIEQSAGLVDTIINIINALLVLAAIAAIVYIILSGVRYITSQGDEDAVQQAKQGLIYAIVGIIVIILAAVIVNFFVGQVATGSSGGGSRR